MRFQRRPAAWAERIRKRKDEAGSTPCAPRTGVVAVILEHPKDAASGREVNNVVYCELCSFCGDGRRLRHAHAECIAWLKGRVEIVEQPV